MPSDQNQGDYNPEYHGAANAQRPIGGEPNHPTMPSAPMNPHANAMLERFDTTGQPYTRGPSDLPPGETPPSDSPGGSAYYQNAESNLEESQMEAATYGSSMAGTDAWLIAKAHEIYTTSTDYMDANITNQWERNLAHFNNEHAPSTNFRRPDWKRSRVFRPKTRASVKAAEASLTLAAFSTQDVVDVQPEDPRDPLQLVSSHINKEILSYRLDRRMPWFQTAVGAYQSTKVYGLCISFQYWKYEADTDYIPAINDKDGSLMMDENNNMLGYRVPLVRKDELACDLIAPENFRFDPMCDWRDPCSTSPYLLYMMPVYAGEALERMESIDPKTGQPKWKKHSLGSILATRRKNYDRTRQAREGRERIDPADEQHGNAYTMLWAHMNIVKVNGTDLVYWTMGTELVLTDPVPLREAFPHLMEGERPFTVGFSTIEAFRNYPAGDVEQSAVLQEEINTIANQRVDNVKLVLNKRYYVRRGAQVDLDALVRNVPGGGVMMNDPEGDVQTINTPDVTSSSYQETDRLMTEMDELIGGFGQTSINAQQKTDQSVGGMNMMQQQAGSISDYGLRIFFETWMEPVLKQLLKLIQYYETDLTVLTLAAKRAQLWQRFGLDHVTDQILQQDLTVRVNVGMGNTDPMRRVEKLVYGVEKAATLPGQAPRIKGAQITDEIFGALGYKDGSRFFMTDEEWEREQQENPPQPPMELQIKEREFAIREEDNRLRHQRELMGLDLEAQLGFAKLALEKQMTIEQLFAQLQTSMGQLANQREQMQTDRDKTALTEGNKVIQLAAKNAGQQQAQQTGAPAPAAEGAA